MATILSILMTRAGRVALACFGVVAFVAYGVWDIHSRGERAAYAKVERNNAVVASKAETASRKSRDPATRGVLNPYYRAD